jgi:histone H1/5
MAGTDVVAAGEVAEEGVVFTASGMGKPEKVVVLKEKKVKAVVSKEMKVKTTKAGNVAAAHPSYLLVMLSFRHFSPSPPCSLSLSLSLFFSLSLSDCKQCLYRSFGFVFVVCVLCGMFSIGFSVLIIVIVSQACLLYPWFFAWCVQMVKEAIGSLKERTGSSQHAIAKYLEEVYKTGLPPNFKKILSVRLRNMTKQGKVYKVKNSFKLSEELKKSMMVRKAGPNKSTLSIKGDSNNKDIEVLKPIKTPKPKSHSRVKKTTTTTIVDGVPVPKSPKPAKARKAPKFENKTHKLPKPGTKPRKLSVTATKKGEEKKFTPPAVAAAAAATTKTKPALLSSLTSKKASGVRKTAAKKLMTQKKSTKSVKTSKSKGVMKAPPGAPSNKAVAKKAKK